MDVNEDKRRFHLKKNRKLFIVVFKINLTGSIKILDCDWIMAHPFRKLVYSEVANHLPEDWLRLSYANGIHLWLFTTNASTQVDLLILL
jgi:hypothetical protein